MNIFLSVLNFNFYGNHKLYHEKNHAISSIFRLGYFQSSAIYNELEKEIWKSSIKNENIYLSSFFIS